MSHPISSRRLHATKRMACRVPGGVKTKQKYIASNKKAVILDALRLENLLSTHYTHHKFCTPQISLSLFGCC